MEVALTSGGVLTKWSSPYHVELSPAVPAVLKAGSTASLLSSVLCLTYVCLTKSLARSESRLFAGCILFKLVNPARGTPLLVRPFSVTEVQVSLTVRTGPAYDMVAKIWNFRSNLTC